MPCKRDDDEIEDRDEDEQERVRESEAVELVDDKEAEYDHGGRVIPEPFPEEAHDEPELHDAVRDEVDRGKITRADGEVLSGVKQITCELVVRILGELGSRDKQDYLHEELLRDEIGGDARDDFTKRKNSLQPQADIEDEVDIPLAKQSLYARGICMRHRSIVPPQRI